MAIIKKLTKLGNSSALVIDRPVLDLLNINNDTPLEISMGTDGSSLIVRPVHNEEENRKLFEEAVSAGNKRYGRGLKKLAER